MKKIYIRAAEQISIQQPLCQTWMTSPIGYDAPYVRAIDPDFREFLAPAETRRLSKVLKRALVTAIAIARETGVGQPDAILAGTGLGCMENTEHFLEALCRNGESMLSPTHFMQSTHNTIASSLAIRSKSQGYNITYAHKDLSFDLALQDAWMQFRLDRIGTALVGGYDELTPSYFTLLKRIGYLGGETQAPGAETAATVLLSSEQQNALCELAGMRIVYRPTPERLKQTLADLLAETGLTPVNLSAVMTGVNGNAKNDAVYHNAIEHLLPGVPTLRYKHLFGTNYSASAYAVYAAAHCLGQGTVPAHMHYGSVPVAECPPQAILLFNQSDGKHYSFTVLRKLCGS